ncbi:hypothetical protein IAT40_001173 [Kwoniella sp. CBS 6097]
MTRKIRQTVCQNCFCGPHQTSMWRSNTGKQVVAAEDNVLCNACGLFQQTHGKRRPAELWGRRQSSPPSSTRFRSRSSTAEESEHLQTPSPDRLAIININSLPAFIPPHADDSIKPERKVKEEVGAEDDAINAAQILMKLSGANFSNRQSSPTRFSPLPLLSPHLANLRPSWIFNAQPKIGDIPAPPGGFHRQPSPQSSIFRSVNGCCPGARQPQCP